jgi:Lon protease-like protein
VNIAMSPDDTIPNSFDGTVRLFPLPNVVLFPRVMLPLHIFEPRYRQMTADALATDRLITMVLLKSGEGEYEERPALHPIACLGKIVADQRLEDGRYNILLRGLNRARIVSEVSHEKAYRSGRVELLYDTGFPDSEPAHAYREDLRHVVNAWFAALGLALEQVSKVFQSDLPLGALIDILSFALPLSIEFKQELLQQLDVEKRAQRLLQFLQLNEPPKTSASGSYKFPPEFSTN